ncbi:MAG: sarcosine oxidase [Pseudonocardiales bacterium]|nr:MAG: sarcosine oxidase [Pseudonocardiales bacterium]
MTAPMRLPSQPGEVIDRTVPLMFGWNGRAASGYAGDTITSALAASGERVFSRSFKYHRPRGILTAAFDDPGCTVQVGDEPNVRAAHRRLAAGMDVRAENAWPSLKYDVKAANQLVGRFLGAGFYYKTFISPQRLWPAYESVLRRFSAGGSMSVDARRGDYDKRYVHVDVLVAGGGPAGMAAALAAADAGASVLLVEQEYDLGGHLRYGGAAELATLRELRDRVAAADAIEVLTDSVAIGRYEDNWIAVMQRTAAGVAERLVKARARSLVVAPGLIERPYVFAGNDLPGVMLSTGVRRLINLYAVKPGLRAAAFIANEAGDAAVEDLRRAGVQIAHVADARRGTGLVHATGRGGLRSVRFSDRTVEADLLVTAVGWTAPTALASMAGDRPEFDPGAARFFPTVAELPGGIYCTGGLAGDGSLDELVGHATAVGRAAATRSRVGVAPLPHDPHPALFHGPTDGFVDLCEDVTSKDLATAVAEGYDGAELAKRYTTSTMGPTQGKLEVVNTIAMIAELTGRGIAETGTTTWRPPYAPVTLGALAGRTFEPVRYSPMQPWHSAHGAKPLVAGAWIRPDHYGDPAAEVRAVRSGVGIIDVTPIGKLDLQGPDVAKLLNLLYVNKWSKLGIGRVRYGAMCADDGVVFDDGVTGRLAEDHYLMSTTSSGAAAVWEWVENWLQTEHPEWAVHVTPVTTSYASINVAGPKSRELIARVTDVDLSPDDFGYMHVRTGRVAGVEDSVLWRIGFTGELSYELHVPGAFGLHVWETLLREGADLGVRAFGVEAQRILRLEKGHLIVGQDTDGLTRGFSAGLDWAIKLDKDDFVGKPELVWQGERSDHPRLVGLATVDPQLVPPEASQIVAGGEIVGRVTSSRMSPTLRRSVCLAQLADRLARPGTTVNVRLPDGRTIQARVTDGLAAVDPDGKRMRV